MKRPLIVLFLLSITLISMRGNTLFSSQSGDETNDYRQAIITDWQEQEADLGREPASRESLTAVIARGEEFLDWAAEQDWCSEEALVPLKEQLTAAKEAIDASDSTNVQQAYIDLRFALREVALRNPAVADQPLVFMKGERYTWQMLHEYMSYYYQVSGMNGGGVYLLKEPGRSFETESLTQGRFPKGVFSTLSLSYDAETIYFAFADLSKVQADETPRGNAMTMQSTWPSTFESEYMTQEEGKFHLFKMDLVTGDYEQITTGPNDDFDPVELPDGNLVFVSTRRGGFGRCHGGWEPLRVHSLHRLDSDGNVTCLSWHETNEWQPTVMNDGRILYTRWDYVDRSASRHHGLWTTNPDGTNAAILFGNYTYDINACYQAKAIPDSKKILFIGGAHHLDIGGPLVMLDPLKVHYDPETAEDDLAAMEVLTPETELPEVADDLNRVCQHYYHSPWPLSEDVWLTAYSHEPLGGYLANTVQCGKLGLYYRDRFGNFELLYINGENEESAMYPIPIAAREKPPVIPSSLPADADNFGTFVLSNVYESLKPFPENRKIKELRIIQLLPKGPDHRGNVPPVGYAFAANARTLLGTVPVEKDGSAYFKVPACTPVYFQAVDEQGKAVQSMRSLVYLQPGENRGCIGCHEQALTVQANATARSLASLRAPSEILPGPAETHPFSYPRFIQPVLDQHCVSCHDGSETSAKVNLTASPAPPFNESYNQLKPYVRWYEWPDDVSYRKIVTFPGECGADISPLTEILNDDNHKEVKLSDRERKAIWLWLDLNAPFYGVYDAAEQEKQLNGESVPLPALQ
ncbi:MAG: hypothetical protein Q4G68_02290 [Planctomycetia bacterium]|nr:hypothetical protein [Planctomycetia bacterium]